MGRALVVCYSLTGHTQRVADAVAARLGATLEPIRETRPRAGVAGYLRAGWEALRKRPAGIVPATHDPGDYDLVVVGTPVWAGNMSSPVRAYIDAHAGRLRHVAFFCTQGGSGGERVCSSMASLCGADPVATLVVTERQLRDGSSDDAVAAFTAALRAARVPGEGKASATAASRRS